jgi:integrase
MSQRHLDAQRYLHPDEVKRIYDWIDKQRAWALSKGRKLDVRNTYLVELMLGTGLRRFEVAALKVGDVRVGRGQREVVVRRGKGGKQRVVVIPPSLKEGLKAYLDFLGRAWSREDGDPLFPSSRGGHLDNSAVHRIWVAALTSAGVEHRKGVACHSARHAYGVMMYRTTKDLRLVQEQLGHASPNTTQVYASVLMEDVEAGVDRTFAFREAT